MKGVKVFGFVNGKIKKVDTSYIYRERVKKILIIRTRRGREIKLTKLHKLPKLINRKIVWIEAFKLKKGDIILVPSKNYSTFLQNFEKKQSKFIEDTIEEIKEIEYNDYVYDFVVPEGHVFVGGELPTLFHNTQIGFQLAVNVQLPKEKGGLEGNVIWIDSEHTFSSQRIISMAKAVGLDPDKTLKNIYVARAYNSEHQVFLVEKLPEEIEEKNVRLIVVDSITSHFRADFIGRGELARRQQLLNKHLHQLQRLADAYNLAVYITNQVMARPDVLFGDPTAPVGGHVLAHLSKYRVYIRRGKGGLRIARMIDAPNLPEAEAVFKITEEGIRDP